MTEGWCDGTAGLLRLPSGTRVRGRGLRAGDPPGQRPTLGIYLAGRRPPATAWESRWVRWPDFWLPTDPHEATQVLTEVLVIAPSGRVELACGGGIGRTGTALAALCVLEGLDPDDAVSYVRAHYAPRAVEVPWQRRFLRALPPAR